MMLKILINAYACRPNTGSEAGAAWRWITGLARENEVFVITEGEWKSEIEVALKLTPYGDRIHFFYNPVSDRVRKMCWNQGDYRFYYYYDKWQKKTLNIAKGIIEKESVDLIHQLNMISFREPGYLWKIKGPKFVWGPVGGMSRVPMQYLDDAPIALKLKYIMKNMVSRLQYSYHPRVMKCIKRADAIIAANRSSYNILTQLHPEKKIYPINETGSNAVGEINRAKKLNDSFELLFVGRFIPTKLLELALQVVGSLKDLPDLKFHIVGKAFNDRETERYHQIAARMGVDRACEWHGWITHEEVQQLMRKSDVFFFPSVVEGTPHVVLESIANGLPVVCFDVCGQADAVNDTVGCKIGISNPAQSIKDFAEVLRSLYYDRNKLKLLSEGCVKRRQELSWEKKIEAMENIYRGVINEKHKILSQ